MRKIRLAWIIAALLTTIVLANLVIIFNIVKLFLNNRTKPKIMPALTTTTNYSTIDGSQTTKLAATNISLNETIKHQSETHTTTIPNIIRVQKYRRKYRFDKKRGKYVRIRKKPTTPHILNNTDIINKSQQKTANINANDPSRSLSKANNNLRHSVQLSTILMRNTTERLTPEVSATQTTITIHHDEGTPSENRLDNELDDKIEVWQAETIEPLLFTVLVKSTLSSGRTTQSPSTATQMASRRSSASVRSSTDRSRTPVTTTGNINVHFIPGPSQFLGIQFPAATTARPRIATTTRLTTSDSATTDIATMADRTIATTTSHTIGTPFKTTFSDRDTTAPTTSTSASSTKTMPITRTAMTDEVKPAVVVPIKPIFTTRTSTTTTSTSYTTARTTIATSALTTINQQSLRLSGFTVVTALLDIGRGDWWEYRRPLEKYYRYLDNVLELRVNLMIFVDQKSVNYVHERRKRFHLERLTKVIPITLAELPLHQYIGHISQVIDYEQNGNGWNPEWDDSMRVHPEAKSAAYDILVNSKSFFLYNASIENPFMTENFIWLDAGYGHGNRAIFPPNFHWNPSIPPEKISLIKVTPDFDDISRYTIKDLYRKDWAVISGGFLGGDRYAINRFHRFYHRLVLDLISQRFVDDDQTALVLLIQQQPTLFNVVHGDWFDAFRLFTTQN